MNEYILPILGGVFIGVAAVIMMIFLGRTTGISGIFGEAINPFSTSVLHTQDRLWRILFILGLPIGAGIAYWLWEITPSSPPSGNYYIAIIAGLLVGFGTRLGSGCTSGHGVCGIGRLSKRSFVSTGIFMCTGMITVFVIRLFGG